MKTDGSDMNKKTPECSPGNLKELLNSDYVKKRFMEVMGDKAPAFIASVLSAVQKNPALASCDPRSVLSSAMIAATLDLPIDANLGFSALVPYNVKRKDEHGGERWVSLAQFQIMYKGFIQLALRSGQYKTINVSPVYEDEFESYDIITGDIMIHPVADGYREQENQEKIIGYAAFFRLLNGYERLEYWSIKKIQAHGQRYSKSYENKNGLWKTNPHAMYSKTVLKNALSKWGILSVTMQSAIAADQAVIKDFTKPIEDDNINYIDSASISTGASSEEEGKTSEKSEPSQPSARDTSTAPPQSGGNPTRRGGTLFPADEAADLEGVEPPDFGN